MDEKLAYTNNIFKTCKKIKNEINEHLLNSSFDDSNNKKLDMAVCIVKFCHNKLMNTDLNTIDAYIYDQTIEDIFEKAIGINEDFFKDFSKKISNKELSDDMINMLYNDEELSDDILNKLYNDEICV